MRAPAVIVAALALVACDKPPAAPSLGKPPTPEAAMAFATRFGAAVGSCDPAEVDRFFDHDVVIQRIAMSARSSSVKREVRKEFGPGALGKLICAQLGGENRSYRLLRIKDVDGRPQPVFRLLVEGRVNYHEYLLTTTRAGEVRAGDMYIYMAGDYLTTSAATVIATNREEAGRSLEPRGSEIDEIARLLRERDLDEARRRIRALPAPYRRNKIVRLQEIMIEQMAGDAERYRAVIEAYTKDFPADPSAEFISIEGGVLRKDWEMVDRAYVRLGERLGGDAIIDTRRVSPLIELGRLDAALASARKATAGEPELADGWWALLEAHLARKDVVAALGTMDELGTRFGITDFDEAKMRETPAWAPLLASPEYAAWRRRKTEPAGDTRPPVPAGAGSR